jgi:hypothetical protein
MDTKVPCRHPAILGFAIFCLVATLATFAQQSQSEPKKYLSPQARMAAAKNVYLRNAGGTDIPFNVIQAGIESWPRYLVVNSPDKADLIIEVLAPEESTGTSVSSKTTTDSKSGKPSSSSSSTREFAEIQIIKLTVFDAKTKVALFSATEKPKNAWKERARTESQIECAQKLLTLLRNRVEPPETATPEPSPK